MEEAARHPRAGGESQTPGKERSHPNFYVTVTALIIFPFQSTPEPSEPRILRQGQHVQHRNPFDPKKGLILDSPAASPNTWKTWARVPFPSGKGQATSPTWSLLAPFFPILGKPSLLTETKSGFNGSAGKNKQGWLCWHCKNSSGSWQSSQSSSSCSKIDVWKREQPLVLATGIQVSPLPGECPDPKALESCSLLPSGASGLDLMDF